MSITTILILLAILIALAGAAVASWRRDTSVEQSWALFAATHKLTSEEPLLDVLYKLVDVLEDETTVEEG